MKVNAGKLKLGIWFMGWLAFAPWGMGIEFIQTNQYTLATNATLPAELWLSAGRITLAGQAQDDLFLFGASDTIKSDGTNGVVTLQGECRNDVWALGNSIDLSGQVRDHARFLARTVTVSGSIARGALLIGTGVHLTRTSRLDSDAWLMGENLVAEGNVMGRLTLMGQNVTLSGTFGTNVHVMARDIVVLPGTRIEGNLAYRSATELILDKDVKLVGRLIREPMPVATSSGLLPPLQSAVVQLWLFAAALVVGTIFFWLFPQFGQQAIAHLTTSFWKCLLVGFFVLALSPMVCLLAAMSMVGLPFSLLVMMALGILIYLSKLVVAVFVGRLGLLGFRNVRFVWYFFLGLLLLYVVASAGVIGIVVWFFIVCAGTGSLVLALCGQKLPAIFTRSNLPGGSV
ncbi:MAG: hypothetical protein PHW60_09280 [Kiritimatiellae bacterium]|nr:hypothetical protein [Kiritimatiellia bacterium]